MQLQLSREPRLVGPDGTVHVLAPLDGALLAWLAIEGPTPRARLADLLWPGKDEPGARNSLRQRLFQLHRRLEVALVEGSATLALARGVAHDLEEADSVLGEASVEGLPPGEFTQWLALQRARRHSRLRTALAELADMAEAAHDWNDAVMHARELISLDPLSEDAHRRLMRLHYLSGDRAAALLAFDACERMLKDEVGAAPSDETLALLRTLEAAGSSAALPVAVARTPVALKRPPRLVGRGAAWDTLLTSWQSGRVAVITGEGGMGKSRLLADFTRARSGDTAGLVVCGARPGDERVPYASFSRLLRALPAEIVQAAPASARRELARLLPEWGEPSRAAAGEPDEERRVRLFNAAAAVLGGGMDRGPGLIFDDLHFIDAASLELLGYVIGARPHHWILATRRAEAPPALQAWLGELGASEQVDVVALLPLASQEVAELVDSLELPGTGAVETATQLWQHSGGNPLLVLELVKAAWLPDGPERRAVGVNLQRLVGDRIARLSPLAVRLARCAAIAAPDFSIRLAAQVLGVRSIELADAYAELEAAQVLADDAFVHDLIHDAARASVPLPVARELHAEVARHLEGQACEPARIAHHWERARCWPEAGRAFRAAARRSGDLGRAHEQGTLLADAARCFELGQCVNEQFESVIERASVLCDQMLFQPARAALEQAKGLARPGEQALRVMSAQAELLNLSCELDAAVELAEQGLPAARRAGREDLELRFAVSAATALAELRRAPDAVALLQPYAALAQRQTDPSQRWLYWHSLGLCLDYAGRLKESLPAWEASCEIAAAHERDDLRWQSFSCMAATWSKLGQLRKAIDLYATAEQLARDVEAGAPRQWMMTAMRAHRLRDLGDLAAALPLLDEALQVFTREQMPVECASVEHRLAQLYQQLGQPERAMRLLSVERPNLPPGLRTMRQVHRADVAGDMGHDGLPMLREALLQLPDPDDIYHRMATLFATRWVPAEEGEALAIDLARWAHARERLGLALAAHVRAASCALSRDAADRAAPHAEAALSLADEYRPDSFYFPELWLVAARVAGALGRPDLAERHVADAMRWIRETCRVPAPFRTSFLERNPVNSALVLLDSERGRRRPRAAAPDTA
ncbi:MAG: hypothetical protein E6Q93_26680 [Burkholderiaceae bacterium]|nr:MAG: hypothetical protein E6Q93_26680 [Burkholderiaceae bacterium]